MKPKFDRVAIIINLHTEEASPFYIIGEVRRVMKEAGAPARTMNQFNNDAMAHDYNHLMNVVERYVPVTWIGRDPRVYGEAA